MGETPRTERGFPDTRLGRAVEALHARKMATHGEDVPDGPVLASDEQIKLGTSGLDVDIDEAMQAARMVAEEGLPVLTYRPDLTMNILVSLWIDGLLVGVLHEREGSSSEKGQGDG